MALVGLSPSGAREDDEFFQTSKPATLAFAAAPPGRLVGEIKQWTSRAAGETSFAMGVPIAMPSSGTSFSFTRSCSTYSSLKGKGPPGACHRQCPGD